MTQIDPFVQLYDRKYQGEIAKPLVLTPNAFSTSRYDDVARLIARERGRLLDLGCGGGSLCFALAPAFSEVVGVDISTVRVATATRSLQEGHPDLLGRCRFVCQSVDKPLPFDDQSFDVVVACAVLEHVVDVFEAVDELARVCKRGGCAVITVPNVCYVKHAASLLLGEIPLTGTESRAIKHFRQHGWDGGHLHYFSKKSLGELLAHVGFTPEAWSGDGKWAKVRRWSTNLVGNLTVRARRN